MIKSKKELKFFIFSDRIINGFSINCSYKERLLGSLLPKYKIINFLFYMRKCSYYSNINMFLYYYYRLKYIKLGFQLGFSINYNSFGYGLRLPHYGTIIVNDSARIGSLAIIQPNTCIGENNNLIGNGLYLASGAKIMGGVKLGNNVTISTNSFVNKSFKENNILLVDCPAKIIKTLEPWYNLNENYKNRIIEIEMLKKNVL